MTYDLITPKEEGQGLLEYAVILILVAAVVITALALLGPPIRDMYQQVVNAI
jgi:pilus assembly protein Flp/PilA